MTVYFQATQDIQISTRASRAQYQYTLVSTDRDEVIEWAGKLTQALRRAPALRDVASEAQEGGPRVHVEIDREKAGRLGVSMQSDHRHAQRRLRPAADFHHLRAGQPVPRHPGGAAALPAGPGRAVEDLRHRLQHLDRHGRHRRQHRRRHHQHQHHRHAQRGHRHRTRCRSRPSRASCRSSAPLAIAHQEQFPGGDHQLRSGARLCAVRRGRRHQPGAADDRHAELGHRQLFRRRRRILQVARRRALADPRRRDRRSTSCWACCTRASSTR